MNGGVATSVVVIFFEGNIEGSPSEDAPHTTRVHARTDRGKANVRTSINVVDIEHDLNRATNAEAF